MSQLETYEWSNIWYEKATDTSKPRVLIIGDSITVGYRGHVNAKSDGCFFADAFSGSKGIDNPFFLPETDLVIDQSPRPYSVLTFNNGLHGMHIAPEVYADLYENAVAHLLNKCPEAKIILVGSTPMTDPSDFSLYKAFENGRSLERNAAVKAAAEKFNLPYADLYASVDGFAEYKSGDGCHFTEKGYDVMADVLVPMIKSAIK